MLSVRRKWSPLSLNSFGLVLLLVDFLSKHWFWSRGEYVENTGVSFGWQFGTDWWWILVFICLCWWWLRLKDESRVGERMIILGGVANLIDRLVYGRVIDWINLEFVGLWINLADLYISAGLGIMLMDYWRFRNKQVNENKEA